MPHPSRSEHNALQCSSGARHEASARRTLPTRTIALLLGNNAFGPAVRITEKRPLLPQLEYFLAYLLVPKKQISGPLLLSLALSTLALGLADTFRLLHIECENIRSLGFDIVLYAAVTRRLIDIADWLVFFEVFGVFPALDLGDERWLQEVQAVPLNVAEERVSFDVSSVIGVHKVALIILGMFVCSRSDELPGDALRVLVVVEHVLFRAETLLFLFQYLVDKVHGLVGDIGVGFLLLGESQR